MAWMRQREDDHGVVQFPSFFGFEAVGDSEEGIHPILNMEFSTPDDDDAGSCNGYSSYVNDYCSNNDDDDDDDDCDKKNENEVSYDGDYYQGDSWRCQKMGISDLNSGFVHLERNSKDDDHHHREHEHEHEHEHEEDQMNEMEKNKLFWDTCLGLGEEHENSFNCTYNQLS